MSTATTEVRLGQVWKDKHKRRERYVIVTNTTYLGETGRVGIYSVDEPEVAKKIGPIVWIDSHRLTSRFTLVKDVA